MTARDGSVAAVAGLALGWAVLGELLAPWGDTWAAVGMVVLALWCGLAAMDRLDRLDAGSLILVGWSALAAGVASQTLLASKVTVGWWLAAAVVFLAVRRASRSGRALVDAIIVGSAVVAGAGIAVEFLGLLEAKAGGFHDNANLSLAVMVPAAAIVLTRPRLGAWGIAGSIWLVGCAALTGSRAGLVAIALVGAMVAWNRPRLRVLLMALAGAAVVALGWRVFFASGSLAWTRLQIWRELLALVAEEPLFGIGAGALAEATGVHRLLHAGDVGHYGRVIASAESTLLGLVVRVGLPALVPLVVVVSEVVNHLRRHRPHRVPVVAAVAVLLVLHDVLAEPAILVGLAVIVGRCCPVPEPGPFPGFGWLQRLVMAGSVAWLLAWGVAQPAVARLRWYEGPESADAALVALKREPWMAEAGEWRVQQLLSANGPWSWEEAAEALAIGDHLVAVASGSAEAWYLRGGVAARVATDLGVLPGTVERTRESFQRAAILEPRLPWSRLAWATFERSAGESERAGELVREALANEPNLMRGWALLVQLELDSGRLDRAHEITAKAREVLDRCAGRPLSSYDREILKVTDPARRALSEAGFDQP